MFAVLGARIGQSSNQVNPIYEILHEEVIWRFSIPAVHAIGHNSHQGPIIAC